MSEQIDLAGAFPPQTGNYILVNAYDDLIRSNVWRLMMTDPDMCHCEKCFLDVCALVFNSHHGYAKFVTTKSGATLAKVPEMSYGRQAEMTVAILEAITRTKDFPKHEA